MYCKNCGSAIPDGAKFCQVCGKNLILNVSETPVSKPYIENHGKRPDNYLALSIVVTLLCCIPFGIVGIVYAGKVDTCWNAGDYDAARTYSKKAKSWALWGIFIYVVLVLLMFLFYLIGFFAVADFADVFA